MFFAGLVCACLRTDQNAFFDHERLVERQRQQLREQQRQQQQQQKQQRRHRRAPAEDEDDMDEDEDEDEESCRKTEGGNRLGSRRRKRRRYRQERARRDANRKKKKNKNKKKSKKQKKKARRQQRRASKKNRPVCAVACMAGGQHVRAVGHANLIRPSAVSRLLGDAACRSVRSSESSHSPCCRRPSWPCATFGWT